MLNDQTPSYFLYCHKQIASRLHASRCMPPRTANPNPAVFVGAKIGQCASTIELDPKHVDVAVRRWANLSGETALHAETGLTFAEESVGRASNFKQSPTLSPYQDLAQAPEQVRNRMHAA